MVLLRGVCWGAGKAGVGECKCRRSGEASDCGSGGVETHPAESNTPEYSLR